MAGFGDDLRRERESQGMTLDALCAETRVNSRHLAALEQGEYGLLPGGVFRRGIVRAYLAALALDQEPWMLRFQQELERYAEATGRSVASGEEAWAEFAASVKRNRATPAQRPDMRWAGVVVLLLLLVVALAAAWHFVLQGRLRIPR